MKKKKKVSLEGLSCKKGFHHWGGDLFDETILSCHNCGQKRLKNTLLEQQLDNKQKPSPPTSTDDFSFSDDTTGLFYPNYNLLK